MSILVHFRVVSVSRWVAVIAVGLILGAGVIVAGDERVSSPQRSEHLIEPPADDAEPYEVILERAHTELVAGEPLGVGRIELEFLAGHGPVIYPDQALQLHSTDQRALYAAFDLEYQQADDSSPYQVKRIEAHFLVDGQGPIELSLQGPHGDLLNEKLERIVADPVSLQRLKPQWWQSFSTLSQETRNEPRQLKEALLDSLARRHGFSIPPSQNADRKSKELDGLEAQFERAIGMLFGIESVKIAMQDDVTLRESTIQEMANQPVPNAPRLNSIAIPSFQATPIEPIAMHVPAECFYVRTGNAANYLYFRKFLTGWGGSLDDIVSHGSLDHEVRRKLEFQLGLDSETISAADLDESLSDMALIGCDPLFQDGAAVGVLFEARDSMALANKIKSQRIRMRQQYTDVDERRLSVARNSVSYLSTDDHRVRSFYAIDGRYHLVTNSEYILNRFFEAGQGNRTLGKLDEFAYARSKAKSTGESLAFLYLSDPFFQHLVSPRYRIEMTRRALAARELQQLQLARLVAQVEQIPVENVTDLIQASLLTKNFGNRPDGSRATFTDSRYLDTVRGVRGTFLPVPDVPIDKATPTEVSAYRSFVADYNRQWGRVDPVAVVFSKQAVIEGNDLHRVGLEILVTPYARQRYALLNTHLAEPSQRQFSTLGNDLLSVQAAVRLGQSFPSHLLAIGLQDDEVPFAFEDGKIQIIGQDDEATFAKSRCYAAITPPSTDVLRMLASVLLKGESPPPPVQQQAADFSIQRLPPPLSPLVPQSGQLLYYFAWALRNAPPGAMGAAKYLSMIETRDAVTIVSETDKLRERVFVEIKEDWSRDPHKVRLRMGSLQGAKIEPYIQAFTYLDARRASSQNCRLLNEWSDWLGLSAEDSRGTIENLLGAKLRCPLGGDFKMAPLEEGVRWTGSRWTTESLFELSETPADWKFSFLDWLQGLDLRFDLDANTLRAQVVMDVRMEIDTERDGWPVKLAQFDRDAELHSGLAKTASFETTPPPDHRDPNEWILGIRVQRDEQRIRVSMVHADSPASRAGIRSGDLIERIDGIKPDSRVALVTLIEQSQRRGFVHLELTRQTSILRLRIPL